MNTWTIVLLIIIAILIAALVALYFFGRNLQTKQAEQEKQIEATKQPVTMLIIDKKRMKIKEAGLPPQVMESTPWYMKRSKVPVVRCKVGPQILNMVCDEKIFDIIPVKKQVKAMVSGIYIAEVQALHGQKLEIPEPKKKNPIARFMDKVGTLGGAKPVNKK